MSLAKTLKGTQFLIKVSDGATSPAFAHPCLINAARGIQFSAGTNDIRVPDCSDPDLIAWLEREKTDLGATINGAGTLHTVNTEEYFDWWKSPSTKACRIELGGVSAGNGGGYFSAALHLTNFGIDGEVGNKAQCSLTFVSSGEITWTDAS
jgi:hypothetical protein